MSIPNGWPWDCKLNTWMLSASCTFLICFFRFPLRLKLDHIKTIELLLPLMNCCNMCFQVSTLSEASQMEHLIDFFPPWTLAKCFFKSCFVENLALRVEHTIGFFFSWYSSTFTKASITNQLCLSCCKFVQSFCPSCTATICLFKCPFWPNLALQMEHLNGFSWIIAMCFQVCTSSKARITNGTLEWLLPLMYCCKMSFQACT